MATCRAWRQSAAAPELWQGACERRWRSGGTTGQLAGLVRQGRWIEVYRLRRQADARTLALLEELQQPEGRQGAAAQLRQAGGFAEVRDLLEQLMAAAEGLRQPAPAGPGSASAAPALGPAGASEEVPASASASAALVWADPAAGAAAQACWPDTVAAAAAAPCAAAYWARSVHSELGVQHWAQRLRSTAARAAAAQQELAWRRSQVLGGEAASAAAGAAEAAGAQTAAEPPGVQQAAAAPAGTAGTAAEPARAEAGGTSSSGQGQEQERQQAGEGMDLAGLSEEQLELLLGRALEEGALALAHVHNPLADLRWVKEALDNLGQELRRRMQAQGATTAGLPALRLLVHLLFGEGPPPQHPRFSAIPPPDGHGLELRGNRERYYAAANSLLNAVLTSREGLPISLALLLAGVCYLGGAGTMRGWPSSSPLLAPPCPSPMPAPTANPPVPCQVGARAGLRISLLNVPMHVVCAMDLFSEAGPSAGAAAGAPARVYIDAFDGGKVMDSREFAGFLRSLGLPPAYMGEAQASLGSLAVPLLAPDSSCLRLLHVCLNMLRRLSAVLLTLCCCGLPLC
ncbi:hypothetical protein ABPG75_011745 [Micractinium tetrahymenae]